MFCGRSHYKDGRRVAALPSTVKGEFPTFPQGYEIVTRKLDPGLRPRRHGSTRTILTTGSEDVNADVKYAPFLVGIECLTTKPIYSSARRFHDCRKNLATTKK